MKKMNRFVALLLLALVCTLALPMVAYAGAERPTITAEKSTVALGENVSLSWTEIAGASSYTLCVSKSPYGTKNLVVDKELGDTKYTLEGLSAGSYRANVKADGGKYSKVIYFTVTDPSAPDKSASFVSSGTVDFLWPVKEDASYTGSSFCITAMDLYYDGGNHGTYKNALDINHDGMQTRYATREIVAAASGTVIEVHKCRHTGISCGTRSCDGCYVRIAHEINGQDYITAYLHLDPKTVQVAEGDKVYQGQTIARMGSTGNSSGLHLHFAIRDGDNNDLPTLEYFMNSTYMPKLVFKYYKEKNGTLVTTNGKKSRYSDWISEHYTYSGSQWVYAG